MRKIEDYEEVFSQILDGMHYYLSNSNINNLVLGLSGGLDSTVVAALAYALSKEYPEQNYKLYEISLPSKTNELDERNGAKLCESFCNGDYKEFSIDREVTLMIFNASKNGYNPNDLQKGNIKARVRMTHLYNAASILGGLVLDTDNLTEHYLGFFTIHGDVADLNPIGDLWKHEVYELAEYLCTRTDLFNKTMVEALKAAIKITPTDGNGVMAGGDMAQIAPGCTYDQVDRVIEDYLNFYYPIEKYVKEHKSKFPDISEENIHKIVTRIRNTVYKRKKLPIKIGIAPYTYDDNGER